MVVSEAFFLRRVGTHEFPESLPVVVIVHLFMCMCQHVFYI